MRSLNSFPWMLAIACAVGSAEAAEPPPQSPEERADELENQAKAAATTGRLSEAVSLLKEAWKLDPTYSTACNLGRVQFLRRELREAAEFLSICIDAAPPLQSDAERARYKKTLQHLTEAREAVVALTVEVDRPGAAVIVDNAQVGVSPLRRALFVEPGVHHVTAELAGYEAASTTISGQKGASLAVALKLCAMPPAEARETSELPAPPAVTAVRVGPRRAVLPMPARRPPPESVAVPLLVSASGSAIAAATGAFLWSLSTSAYDGARQDAGVYQRGHGGCPGGSCEDVPELSDGNAFRAIGATSLALAGALGAVTVGIAVLRPQKKAAPAARTSGRGTVAVAVW